jgi:hypothetical protein
MAWTVPRTWVEGEVPTAAIFNTHIRDNIALLKTPLSDAGRVIAIDFSRFASLSGTALTGVTLLGSANAYSAGRTRFTGTARFRLPVGADKFAGVSGNKTPGSAWIEGQYLHWIDSGQDEWRYLGALAGTPVGALVGSIWVEGFALHYIDASGGERLVSFIGASAVHTDAAALAGSVWVEGDYLNWIAETGGIERIAHQDVAHADGSAHQDVGFQNHGDHTDVPFQDFADHTNVLFSDFFDEIHADHLDGEMEHQDTITFANHVDIPHQDLNPHSDVSFQNHGDHSDVAHQDHTDHSDVAAVTTPPDLIGPI